MTTTTLIELRAPMETWTAEAVAALVGPERAVQLGRRALLCLAGHLQAIQGSDEEARRVLSAPRIVDAVTRSRQALAARLFEGARIPRPFSNAVRHAYGIMSEYHERAYGAAIASGAFDEQSALFGAFNAPYLEARLRDFAPTVPLSFPASLGTDWGVSSPPPSPFEGVIQVATTGATFDIRVANAAELMRATTLQTKEAETVRWLQTTFTAQSTLYDVGANIGIYSLYALSLAAGARAICFEPDPQNFARLSTNIAHNALQALAFPVALTDFTAPIAFASRVTMAGATTGVLGHATEGRMGTVSYRLDDFLRAAPWIPLPTHLKVDVDGAELLVLRGAAEALRSPTLEHLLVELPESEEASVTRTLVESGFSPVSRHLHTPQRAPRARIGNYVFRRTDPH